MSSLNELPKRPIADFLLSFPNDTHILRNYPEATHWALTERKFLVLYKEDAPQTIIADFDTIDSDYI
jgi:hypothetical protein